MVFDNDIQEILILGAHDICSRRSWRLHAVGTDPSHVHIVVSWRGYLPVKEAIRQLKNVLSYLLGKTLNERGRRWVVTNASRKRVMNSKHLTHLIETYLPDHPGLFWREGQPLPADKFGILRSSHDDDNADEENDEIIDSSGNH